ncbi:MAG: UDP-N-acetylglucosamine 2-epimerase (non-hydrolyzing) [Pirellulaceae bacterium]
MTISSVEISEPPRHTTQSRLRVLIAMGTRPEIIKQAPLAWAAAEHPDIDPVICHSGQHADLADPMLDHFQIQPDVHLDLMRSHRTLPSLIGGCIGRSEAMFAEHKIDVVVVQGDTATTAAMSLAAFYARIPVVHVEAGLRTGDLQSPWPEELNRRVATLAASLHCAPTEFARQTLLAENVASERVFVSGNPVVDALQWTLAKATAADASIVGDQPLVVLTAHRRENFGKPLEAICSAVLELTNQFPDHRFVFVTHPNPQAGPVVRSILKGNSRIELAAPMSYPQFVQLMRGSRLIISDSGGIQEEAPTLGVPLLVTRKSTERPEAVQCGAAELVGTDSELIVSRAAFWLRASQQNGKPKVCNPFGDGQAGQRIIEQIAARFAHVGAKN